MSYNPYRQQQQQYAPHGQPQNHGDSYRSGDYTNTSYVQSSDRSASSRGERSYASRGGNTQYTGYTEEGGALEESDRTPYSQGEYTEGGYTQGGYTQQGGYTLNNSDRTPCTQGEYTQSGYTQSGYTRNNSDSDRTPYSQGGYTEGGGTVNYDGGSNYGGDNSSRTGYTSQSDQYQGSDGQSAAGSILSGTSARRRESQSSVLSSQQMSALSSQQYNSAQYDNSSYCSSFGGGTTVADGGTGRCPYQIDFQVQNQGKQMSATKRIIAFRFGFANAKALLQGRTGTDCRGEEHDIVITWSITGGKRSISMDGREIQYTTGKRANAARRADMMEASWRMSDHIYELRCYAYKPAAGSPEKRDPKWRQYALVIDGRGFFELPQIFDLGLKGLRPQPMHSPQPQTQISSNASSSASGIASSYASSQPSEVKGSIQARIDEQRRLMKARKQAVSNEKRQNRSEHEKEKGVKSLDLESMGLESTGLQSGVYSAAPSELSEARNRQEATPLASNNERLATHTGTNANQSGGIGRHPQPTLQQRIQGQHAAQTKQLEANHPPRPPKQYQIAQQYQIQAKPNQNQHNARTKQQQAQNASANHPRQHPLIQNSHQQSNTPQANHRPPQPRIQHQVEAQQHQNQPKPRMERQRPQNARADSSSNTPQVHESSIVFEPQQPPTYEEITRDILGAYDDTSVVESNAGQSSIVPRARDLYTGEVDSYAGGSSIVPRGRDAYGGNNDFDNVSIAERSMVSRDSTIATINTAAKLQQAPGPSKTQNKSSQPQFAKSQVSSSVDTRGVNKWGYF